MSTEPTPDISEDLVRAASGDASALERILPLVHERVREIATQVLDGDRARRWVQASSLVQRAMIRLLDQREVDQADAARITAVLATIMRRMVIDIARRETADKRGGQSPHISLQSWHTRTPAARSKPTIDALEIEDSLVALATVDADAARVAELRLWGGMDLESITIATGDPRSRVRTLWRRAQAWLARDLSGSE